MSPTLQRLSIYTGILAVIAIVSFATLAHAADKAAPAAKDGLADLEERIAELEATTAKKGNRKVRVVISGAVSKSLLVIDDGLTGKTVARVINGPAETWVNIAGSAHFSKELDAGAFVELGMGDFNILEDQLGINQSNDVVTRRAAVWVSSPIGKATLGKDSQATDGIVESSVANTQPAKRNLSFRPLLGTDGITENVDIFDGQRLNVVRYDSPLIQGVKVSASWSRDGTGIGNVADVWDVALRYSGEIQSVKFAAGVGYRKGAVFPGLDPLLPLPQVAFDQETLSGSASLMHMPTGGFVNFAGGQAKFSGLPGFVPSKITAWEVTGGFEERWSALGATTAYVEYSQFKFDMKAGADPDLTYYGAGLIQAIDGAAMSMYVSMRHVDPGTIGDSFSYGLAGMSLQF